MHITFDGTAILILAATVLFYGGANWQLLRSHEKRLNRHSDRIEKLETGFARLEGKEGA